MTVFKITNANYVFFYHSKGFKAGKKAGVIVGGKKGAKAVWKKDDKKLKIF